MCSLLTILSLLSAAPAPAGFDVILANGRVVDGTGAPWFRADVGIRGDRIAAVGDLSKATAVRRVDVADKMVAPGFIDMLGQSVRDLATYEEPSRYAEGVDTVLVNGAIVLDAGKLTKARPGRLLPRR
ncbi:MAG: hypothetical protein ACYC8T_24885 [Myxococcaceae bacterium]